MSAFFNLVMIADYASHNAEFSLHDATGR